MPRPPRRLLVDLSSTNHCTFRSRDLMPLFDDVRIARRFLTLLGEYKARFGILIHSYCLMSTHPHVILTATGGQEKFSAFWQCVNQGIAKYFNKLNDRRGQVVMERLRSPMIKADGRHLLTVMRYAELNPVRAGLVASPKDWEFSSYKHYAFGQADPLVDDAPDYLALGSTPFHRRRAYQQLFSQEAIAAQPVRQSQLSLGPFIGDEPWREGMIRLLRTNSRPFL